MLSLQPRAYDSLNRIKDLEIKGKVTQSVKKWVKTKKNPITKRFQKEITHRDINDLEKHYELEKIKKLIVALPENIRDLVLEGPFVSQNINDNSIDLIVTDPPYGEKYLDLWSDLGVFADRVLRPGKWLISYSGQKHLDEFLHRLGKHLNYFWTMAVELTGTTQILNNVNIQWKPLLVFYKEPLTLPHEVFGDLIRGQQGNKNQHEWAQSVPEAETIINIFSQPGDLVLDPMCGSGTTLIAGLNRKRKVLGCEIDHDHVVRSLDNLRKWYDKNGKR